VARNRVIESASVLDRRKILTAAAVSLASTALPFPMPAFAKGKRFAGLTLRGACYQHPFFTILQGYIPEFEQQTGMTVDLKLRPFPLYNQTADLQLSLGSSSCDVVNVTYYLAPKWVAGDYLTNLDEFTSDPNSTPPDWKPDDFIESTRRPYRDAKGGTFGYPWGGSAVMMGLSRMDIMERRGLKIPQTFDELQQVCAEIHGTGEVNGFVSWSLHHWCLMPYLHGFGGNAFRNPPTDLTPTLNSAQAIQAVEYYANLLKRYAPRGVLDYSEDQARQSLLTGRSNIFIHSSSWVTPALLSEESRVKETARVVKIPAGPVHDFPTASSQGLGIPKNAKNKAAAWEFIRWALSPEMTMRIVMEHGFSSVCRRSVLWSDTYRKITTVNGQDLGALYREVLDLPDRSENYMAYRTVKEFSFVGGAINRAVEMVASSQLSGRDAMNAAQEQAIAALRQAESTL
jgi:multiple sugar transport system substrate-binding protein